MRKKKITKPVAENRPRTGTGGTKRRQAVSSKNISKLPRPNPKRPQKEKRTKRQKRKLLVRVGSLIWENLSGVFLALNLVTRLWKRIDGSDDTP